MTILGCGYACYKHENILKVAISGQKMLCSPHSLCFFSFFYQKSSRIPRPRPAFRYLQYGKVVEGLDNYHMSDVGVERRVERT